MTHVPSSRSRFIAGIATSAAVGTAIVSKAAPQFQLRLAHEAAEDHPKHVRTRQMWDTVEKESRGRIHVDIFPRNQLGGIASILDQLRVGAVQLTLVNSAFLQTIIPTAGIFSLGYAFKNADVALRVADGALGIYICNEVDSKNVYAMKVPWYEGMHQVSTSTHAIRVPDDYQGVKIRTPANRMYVDLFKSLGANPSPVDIALLYTSLQTKVVDAQDATLENTQTLHLYEVQKYLSLTSHVWGGSWQIMNGDVWRSFPADLQAIIERNNSTYAQLERRDILRNERSLVTKLTSEGMVVNTPDPEPFRALLGSYYQNWKKEFGQTAWTMLEAGVGYKLG